MSSLALSFNEVNFTPVEQNGQAYLTSSELATALGYADTRSVTKIYNRYADEFTSNMAKIIENPEVVNLSTSNLVRKVRIFSLRGCHLIAMFSKTAIAKQFRKWVLDILDREVVAQQINSRQVITPEQKDTLQKIVDHKVVGNNGLRAQVWTRHNRHFKINSYHELLAIHFEDAVKYLLKMEVKQSGIKNEVKTLPYPQEIVQVAQQINQEYGQGRYKNWFVSVRDDGVIGVQPLGQGYYPMNVAEFTKRFDGVLDYLYGSDLLSVGRYLQKS